MTLLALTSLFYSCIESNPNQSTEAIVEYQTFNYINENVIDCSLLNIKPMFLFILVSIEKAVQDIYC